MRMCKCAITLGHSPSAFDEFRYCITYMGFAIDSPHSVNVSQSSAMSVVRGAAKTRTHHNHNDTFVFSVVFFLRYILSHTGIFDLKCPCAWLSHASCYYFWEVFVRNAYNVERVCVWTWLPAAYNNMQMAKQYWVCIKTIEGSCPTS